MHYHIILTEDCNLRCRYCYGKSMEEFENGLEEKFKFDFNEPCVSQVKINELKSFLEKDKKAVIIFYGGEPLLQIPKIKQIMDEIDVPYRMQTNGILLHLLEPKYLNKITKILISLDGNEKRTNKNRGKGTYEKVMKNISLIKQNGYSGELIARMTIAQDCPDLDSQVKALINLGFTSVHWQLDVGFYKSDFDEEKLKSFFEEYNKSISRLIDYWVEEIKKENIFKLYPLTGIVESLLSGKPTKLRCGAGHSGYAISTSGKVVACPIMNNIEDFRAGDLSSSPADLKKFEMSECEGCDYIDLCGGRCLYWQKASLWPKEGDGMICDSIKFYIDKLREKLPEIKQLISEGRIKESDFDYEKYFGPEIIP